MISCRLPSVRVSQSFIELEIAAMQAASPTCLPTANQPTPKPPTLTTPTPEAKAAEAEIRAAVAEARAANAEARAAEAAGREAEKNPSAPRMLDAFDEGDLERSSICSMLARYPACVARATAFLGVLGCAPGAVAYAPDLTPELRERLPTSVNATANEDAITITRRVRMCEKDAKDVFDACADVKVLSITTVGAWFGSDPNEFVEIVRRVQRTPRFQRLLASRFN